MLSATLVTRDPYGAASTFAAAGWKVERPARPRALEPRATVTLGGARLVLVPEPLGAVPDEAYAARRSDREAPAPRPPGPRSPGVDLQVGVPAHELSGYFLLHRAAGLATSSLAPRADGRRGFRAEIVGHRFTVLAADEEPDLSLIAADPRVVARAEVALEHDGDRAVLDQAFTLAEAVGEVQGNLRLVLRQGVDNRSRAELTEQLSELVVAAAVLARQLGVDLEAGVDRRLGQSFPTPARRVAS